MGSHNVLSSLQYCRDQSPEGVLPRLSPGQVRVSKPFLSVPLPFRSGDQTQPSRVVFKYCHSAAQGVLLFQRLIFSFSSRANLQV